MRIAQVSYHTNPVAPLGGRHTGGMNIYVSELARELVRDAIERGRSAVDFLRGAEVYKRHLGGEPRDIVRLRLARG